VTRWPASRPFAAGPGTVILGLAVCLWALQPPAVLADARLPDAELHQAAGVVAALAVSAAYLASVDQPIRLSGVLLITPAAAGVSLAIGAVKELIDARRAGTAETRDVVHTVFGGLIGGLFATAGVLAFDVGPQGASPLAVTMALMAVATAAPLAVELEAAVSGRKRSGR